MREEPLKRTEECKGSIKWQNKTEKTLLANCENLSEEYVKDITTRRYYFIEFYKHIWMYKCVFGTLLNLYKYNEKRLVEWF